MTNKKNSKKPTKTQPKNIASLKKEIKNLNSSLANLESQNIILKLENQKNIQDFQKKAKEFQTKAQIEINKVKKNLQEQFTKEQILIKKFGGQKLVELIIGPIINLYQALEIGLKQKDSGIRAYNQGFKMLIDQLLNALEEYGVNQIKPKIGQQFDPNFCHALSTIKDDKRKNLIIEVKQIGFRLHDRVIKPAIVTIGK